MRQVGVLAAAGLIALDHMVDRLAEDHSNAHTLAEGLAELPGVRCDLSRVQTNLVFSIWTRFPRLRSPTSARGEASSATGSISTACASSLTTVSTPRTCNRP